MLRPIRSNKMVTIVGKKKIPTAEAATQRTTNESADSCATTLRILVISQFAMPRQASTFQSSDSSACTSLTMPYRASSSVRYESYRRMVLGQDQDSCAVIHRKSGGRQADPVLGALSWRKPPQEGPSPARQWAQFAAERLGGARSYRQTILFGKRVCCGMSAGRSPGRNEHCMILLRRSTSEQAMS